MNALTTLPADVFEGMDSLWYLKLGDNKIEELPPGVFQGEAPMLRATKNDRLLTSFCALQASEVLQICI
jgi:hypothetical protein